MTAPTTKLDGAMMTDEKLTRLITNLREYSGKNTIHPHSDTWMLDAADALELLSASKPAAPNETRRAALDEAAMAVEKHDVKGREWIPESLWGQLTRESSARIRALAASPAAPATDTEEDAYVINRLSTVLAEVAAALMDDDADSSATDVLAKLPEAAQTLKLEVELYRANATAAPAQSGEPVAWQIDLAKWLRGEAGRHMASIAPKGATLTSHALKLRLWADQVEAPQPAQTERALTRDALQQKAIDHGFQYWRAPDAHGVTGTEAQAVELLQDLLGVEVEIEAQTGRALTVTPAMVKAAMPWLANLHHMRKTDKESNVEEAIKAALTAAKPASGTKT